MKSTVTDAPQQILCLQIASGQKDSVWLSRGRRRCRRLHRQRGCVVITEAVWQLPLKSPLSQSPPWLRSVDVAIAVIVTMATWSSPQLRGGQQCRRRCYTCFNGCAVGAVAALATWHFHSMVPLKHKPSLPRQSICMSPTYRFIWALICGRMHS